MAKTERYTADEVIEALKKGHTGGGRNVDTLADIVAAQAARIAYLEGTIAYLEGIINCEDEDEDVTAEDLGI